MSTYHQLEISTIFEGLKEFQIKELLDKSNHRQVRFSKGEIIAMQGDKIKEVGIILEGEIDVKKLYETGKTLHMKKIGSGEIIGLAFAYADANYYSCTIIANIDSKILFLPKEVIVDLCMSNRQILKNYARLLSNQVVYLSDRVKFVSSGTIRKKIIYYLMDEYTKYNSLKFNVPITRKKMAEIFGVTRPALSNEMIAMRNDGLIDFNGKVIEIVDYNALVGELEK